MSPESNRIHEKPSQSVLNIKEAQKSARGIEAESAKNESLIRRYGLLIDGIEAGIRDLNESKKADTGTVAGIGDWIGEKTGSFETGKSIYQGAISNMASRADELRTKIEKDVSEKNFSETQLDEMAALLARLEKLSVSKLEKVSWGDATMNDLWKIGKAPKVLEMGVRTVTGGAEGAFDSVSGILEITGKVIGMAASYGFEPQTREIIESDLRDVFSKITFENAKKLYDAIPKAFDNFSKLPIEKQAEGAAKLIGSILVPLGIGAKAVSAGKGVYAAWSAMAKSWAELTARAAKVAAKQAERVTWTSKRAMKIAWRAAVAGTFAVSAGVSEVAIAWTAIAGWTAVRYVGEMGMGWKAKSAEAAADKIAEVAAFEVRMAKAEARSGISRETVLKNAALENGERLSETSSLLGRGLSVAQSETVLRVHNEVSRWVYQNGHKELRSMLEELDKVGFSRSESRKMMENGMLGTRVPVESIRQVTKEQVRSFFHTLGNESARINGEIDFWIRYWEGRVWSWNWVFESERRHAPEFLEYLKKFRDDYRDVFEKPHSSWMPEDFDRFIDMGARFAQVSDAVRHGINVQEISVRFQVLEDSFATVLQSGLSSKSAIDFDVSLARVARSASRSESVVKPVTGETAKGTSFSYDDTASHRFLWLRAWLYGGVESLGKPHLRLGIPNRQAYVDLPYSTNNAVAYEGAHYIYGAWNLAIPHGKGVRKYIWLNGEPVVEEGNFLHGALESWTRNGMRVEKPVESLKPSFQGKHERLSDADFWQRKFKTDPNYGNCWYLGGAQVFRFEQIFDGFFAFRKLYRERVGRDFEKFDLYVGQFDELGSLLRMGYGPSTESVEDFVRKLENAKEDMEGFIWHMKNTEMPRWSTAFEMFELEFAPLRRFSQDIDETLEAIKKDLAEYRGQAS